MQPMYDVIVVGAGVAGSIIASRLTEESHRRVLLIEAGPDTPGSSLNTAVADARYVPIRGHHPAPPAELDWGYVGTGPDGGVVDVPQARVVGGGSSINGTIALRGDATDYEEWRDLGNDEWSWPRVAGVFDALEDWSGAEAADDRTAGPVPIAVFQPEELAPVQAAFRDACLSLRIPETGNLNEATGAAFGSLPMMRRGRRRVSMAGVYLRPAVVRPNLTILSSLEVERVLFRRSSVVGVRCSNGDTHYAKEVVLCAGAIGTATLLQRSGVGPTSVLETADVGVVADLPVGTRLLDHPVIPIVSQIQPEAIDLNGFGLQLAYRGSSGTRGASPDVQLLMHSFLFTGGSTPGTRGVSGLAARDAAPATVAAISCVLNKSDSAGSVHITCPGSRRPLIKLNGIRESRDRDGMRAAVELGLRIFTTDPFPAVVGPPPPALIAAAGDDRRLDELIQRSTVSGYHFAGTCPMGGIADPNSVVDQYGKVHGLSGLRVCDASVMPTIPAANTMHPTAMVAEVMAGFLNDSGSRVILEDGLK